MIKRILICALLVFMVGCTPKTTPPNYQVIIDPSLLVECAPLPVLDAGVLAMGGLYTEYSNLQGQYIECAIRHDCLIKAVGDDKEKLICTKLQFVPLSKSPPGKK